MKKLVSGSAILRCIGPSLGFLRVELRLRGFQACVSHCWSFTAGEGPTGWFLGAGVWSLCDEPVLLRAGMLVVTGSPPVWVSVAKETIQGTWAVSGHGHHIRKSWCDWFCCQVGEGGTSPVHNGS